MSIAKKLREVSLKEANTLKVLASAGSGKTTFLVNFSNTKKDKKFLYLVFSEAMAKDVKFKFGKNVISKTFHSLAYDYLENNLKNKISNKYDYEKNKYLKYLLLKNSNKNFIFLHQLLKSIEDFTISKYKDISAIEQIYYSKKFLNQDVYPRKEVRKYINELWNLMLDPEVELPISHDFYLKTFQINMNKYFFNFDYILVDESQDINDCMASIINNFQNNFNSKIVYVGDDYQNIFGFKGTKNIINEIDSDHEVLMKKSYRFGKNIAETANLLIKLNDDEKNIISGNSHVVDSVNKNDFNFNEHFAIISRYNATLISKAIKYAKKGKKLYFTNQKNLNYVNKIIDIYYLQNKEKDKIRIKEIKYADNIDYLLNNAIINSDRETEIICKLVINNKENNNFIEELSLIKQNIVNEIDKADIVLTTSHGSKGLEFKQVALTNDYYNFFDKNGVLKKNIPREEINILYVAITRAKTNLIKNKILIKIEEYLMR